MGTNFLAVAEEAARAAGSELVRRYKSNQIETSVKDNNTIVSDADYAAEKISLDILRKNFPAHGIFSEEGDNSNSNSDYTWIVDPLDGTTNFVHRLGSFSVSIALLQKTNVVVGVVFNPLNGELFSAERGKGAHLNETTLTVSTVEDISKAVIGANRNPDRDEVRRYGAILETVLQHVRTSRVIGSVALDLAYVASGRLDALITNGCQFHDGAAGTLIAQEAGGMVSDFKNKPWQPGVGGKQDMLVTNNKLHKLFISILNNL